MDIDKLDEHLSRDYYEKALQSDDPKYLDNIWKAVYNYLLAKCPKKPVDSDELKKISPYKQKKIEACEYALSETITAWSKRFVELRNRPLERDSFEPYLNYVFYRKLKEYYGKTFSNEKVATALCYLETQIKNLDLQNLVQGISINEIKNQTMNDFVVKFVDDPNSQNESSIHFLCDLFVEYIAKATGQSKQDLSSIKDNISDFERRQQQREKIARTNTPISGDHPPKGGDGEDSGSGPIEEETANEWWGNQQIESQIALWTTEFIQRINSDLNNADKKRLFLYLMEKFVSEKGLRSIAIRDGIVISGIEELLLTLEITNKSLDLEETYKKVDKIIKDWSDKARYTYCTNQMRTYWFITALNNESNFADVKDAWIERIAPHSEIKEKLLEIIWERIGTKKPEKQQTDALNNTINKDQFYFRTKNDELEIWQTYFDKRDNFNSLNNISVEGLFVIVSALQRFQLQKLINSDLRYMRKSPIIIEFKKIVGEKEKK